MHLFLGSEGTLGILTAAHLRLHRLPLHRQFDSYRFPALGPAVAALQQCLALGLRPLVARIHALPERLMGETGPGKEGASERTGVVSEPGEVLLILAFEGPPELVEAELAVAGRRAVAQGGESAGPAPARRWWGKRLVGVFRFGPLLQEAGTFADLVEVGSTWQALPRIYERLRDALTDLGLRVAMGVEHACLESASIGCVFWGRADTEADALDRYDAAWRVIRNTTLKEGGHLAHVYGAGVHRVALLDPATTDRLSLLAAAKHQLDPAGIMNPGVLAS
jgi:alkyldihydroxyacetonephosphate synthase